MHLDATIEDAVRGFRAMQFDHRGFGQHPVAAFELQRAIDQHGLGRVELGGAIRDQDLDRLMLPDGDAESLADLRIFDGLLESPARHSHTGRRQAEPSGIDAAQRHLQPLVDRAQSVIVRDPQAVEGQDADFGAELTHDGDRRHDRESRRFRVDEESS